MAQLPDEQFLHLMQVDLPSLINQANLYGDCLPMPKTILIS